MQLSKICAGLFILSFVAITSCKDDNNDNPNPNPPNNTVLMQNDRFEPASLLVTTGTTVKWINKENEMHTVTSNDTLLFDSGDLLLDETYSYTFTTPGTYNYYCRHHQGMVGKIVVH